MQEIWKYFRKTFERMEKIERMVGFAYSENAGKTNKELVNRIAEELLKNKTYQEIVEELGIGISTLVKYINPEIRTKDRIGKRNASGKNISYLFKCFTNLDRVKNMIYFAYSDNGKYMKKEVVDKIAEGVIELRKPIEICKELKIDESTFYRYLNPELRVKHNEYMKRKYREDENYRKRKRELERKRYWSDPAFRRRMIEKSKIYQMEKRKLR